MRFFVQDIGQKWDTLRYFNLLFAHFCARLVEHLMTKVACDAME